MDNNTTEHEDDLYLQRIGVIDEPDEPDEPDMTRMPPVWGQQSHPFNRQHALGTTIIPPHHEVDPYNPFEFINDNIEYTNEHEFEDNCHDIINTIYRGIRNNITETTLYRIINNRYPRYRIRYNQSPDTRDYNIYIRYDDLAYRHIISYMDMMDLQRQHNG